MAVLPLLCAASLLLATFWTHPADTARLKLNSAVLTILVVTLLALRCTQGLRFLIIRQWTEGLLFTGSCYPLLAAPCPW